VDILAIIDNLNGRIDPPLPMYQCDIDRSGKCLPADILRVIDLLNGAHCFYPWNGACLPEWPSAWCPRSVPWQPVEKGVAQVELGNEAWRATALRAVAGQFVGQRSRVV
jgi:hypothetical protein